HGCLCRVCGIDMMKVYGEIAKGFIHIHHLIPLSDIKENYSLDPKKDLIPVCPNCHAMLHRRNPPFSSEELKSIIKHNSFKPQSLY
ncbi:TPA: HNH endonuclease, partial [Klebsiella pneumoniae]